MNLINDKWIPIRRLGGEQERVAPWQITDQHEGNRIVALDAPRPDFNGALMQFLIGLLQVAAPPEQVDDSDWAEWLEQVPSPELLRERLVRYESAFNLEGDGPRFMQDFERLEVEKLKSVAALLIDTPGGNTLKNNADHFVKRGGVPSVCPSCVAMALFTLQTNAPEGGRGNLTSLRGGGPLTTLVVLDPKGDGLEESLWRDLWLNVLNKSSYSQLSGNSELNAEKDIFPWLATTRVSGNGGVDTYALDVNPLQMYWGMPRRIRLDWDNVVQGECSLCGEMSEQLIQYYAAKPSGVNYSGVWQHPLSPHRVDSRTGEVSPLHPQPGGFSYRHWLVWASGNEQNLAALAVRAFSGDLFGTRKVPGSQLRLSVFGYEMDSMKARCWYESTVPLYTVPAEYREVFSCRVAALVSSSEEFVKILSECLREAWYDKDPKKNKDNKKNFHKKTSFVSDSFFNHTERAFYSSIVELIGELKSGGDGSNVLAAWHGVLRRAAIDLFDHWVAQESVENANPRRIAEAHKKLLNLIHSKKIQKLLPFKNKEVAA